MNRSIIVDANKCIGCRTCEMACVVSHQDNQDCTSLTPETFLPRIHTIKGANASTATPCRQCEDAPHANVCLNGAIDRDKGFVHVMRECYIDCRTYVTVCPYDAIEMIVRPIMRNSDTGLSIRVEKAEASKCSLYHHREAGPACMKVCPTHMLIYANRNRLEQLSAEKRHRAVPDPIIPLLF